MSYTSLAGTCHTSSQLNVESGFSFAFQILIVSLFFLRGSVSCSLFVHLLCFLNSTQLTYTASLLSLLYLCLLPSWFKR